MTKPNGRHAREFLLLGLLVFAFLTHWYYIEYQKKRGATYGLFLVTASGTIRKVMDEKSEMIFSEFQRSANHSQLRFIDDEALLRKLFKEKRQQPFTIITSMVIECAQEHISFVNASTQQMESMIYDVTDLLFHNKNDSITTFESDATRKQFVTMWNTLIIPYVWGVVNDEYGPIRISMTPPNVEQMWITPARIDTWIPQHNYTVYQ